MPSDFDAQELERRLALLGRVLPTKRTDLDGVPDTSLKKLLVLARGTATTLEKLVRWLDPVDRPDDVFDPSDPHDAAEIIRMKLETVRRRSLSTIKAMYGAGVYALYYAGFHPAYAAIKSTETPIYVGKADPKDRRATDPTLQGVQLFQRLKEHLKNIQRAERCAAESGGTITAIALAEFECRYLVTPGTYVTAVEASLIDHYQPVWNTVCPGFGKHGDSPKTRANERSEWDTLHPGRPWATREDNVSNARTAAEIQQAIVEHLRAVAERRG